MSDLHVVGGVSTDWIIGWKAAYAAVAPDLRTLRFRPVAVGDGAYGVDAQAACVTVRSHVAPHDMCKCGFNSWHERDLAIRYMRLYQAFQIGPLYRFYPTNQFRWSVVLLRVGAYGDVIEGTLNAGYDWQQWGYRASNQRVADVFFDGVCVVPGCHEEARYICVAAKTPIYGEPLRPLRLHCASHAVSADYILQPSGLARYNNVDIHRKLPSE